MYTILGILICHNKMDTDEHKMKLEEIFKIMKYGDHVIKKSEVWTGLPNGLPVGIVHLVYEYYKDKNKGDVDDRYKSDDWEIIKYKRR